ncbi:hypothetical protein ACFVH7_18020, partial [Kitasatospora indigofera]|uniref:hypothetical protein n=1 Tax=Kitasatospora indigofera TaxID=67307 RepID=UPI003630CB29
TRLANDTTLNSHDRVRAAESLAGVAGFEQAGADLLTRLADDTTLDSHARVRAAASLAGMDSFGRARMDSFWQARAAGMRQVGVNLLTRLADDTTLNAHARLDAAESLAGVAGFERAGADLLTRLANDTTLNSHARAHAAEYLT